MHRSSTNQPTNHPPITVTTNHRKLLEARGSLVIRQLCVLLEPQSIYLSLAAVLSDKGAQEEGSLEFVGMMVQVRRMQYAAAYIYAYTSTYHQSPGP